MSRQLIKTDAKSQSKCLRLAPEDNSAIALTDLRVGESLFDDLHIQEAIPTGHKFALKYIKEGEVIRKYGQIIGYASTDVFPGTHLHSHNIAMRDVDLDYAYCVDARPTAYVAEPETKTFRGYRRADKRVGTRNYIGIVTTVNCSATVARHIAQEVERRKLLQAYPNVDGVVAITHGVGCCINTDDESFRILQRTVRGYANHPNFAAVLVLGLGCEANQISGVTKGLSGASATQFQTLTIQGEGGTRATIETALERLKIMLPEANKATRSDVPVSELCVALQCGGSDGYSGITANPALGKAVDLLVQHGGTAALGETPEVFGAEHLLTRRAETRAVGEKLVERIAWWKEYAATRGATLNNNPTPGNKEGGLTTILEKSLGAVAKGGSTNLTGVYGYAEPIQTKGFVLVDSPGYDPCSLTGQVASGCNLICFTTGRGSVYGNKPVPSIKLATNTSLYERMQDDMDINCGEIVTGTETIDTLGAKIFEQIVAVASGEKTKSEEHGFGDSEFVPWLIGAQL